MRTEEEDRIIASLREKNPSSQGVSKAHDRPISKETDMGESELKDGRGYFGSGVK